MNSQFVKSSIVEMMENLKDARKNNHSSEYKTLTECIRELMTQQYFSEYKNLNTFFELLSINLEIEISNLQSVMDNAMNDKDFRAYHKWVISYNKLNKINEEIKYNFRQVKRNDYIICKNTGVLKVDTYEDFLCLSFTKDQAFGLITKLIRENGDIKYEPFRWNGDKSRLEVNGHVYRTGSLNNINLIRGLIPDIVYVDKAISLKDYLEKIEPISDNFKEIKLI